MNYEYDKGMASIPEQLRYQNDQDIPRSPALLNEGMDEIFRLINNAEGMTRSINSSINKIIPVEFLPMEKKETAPTGKAIIAELLGLALSRLNNVVNQLEKIDQDLNKIVV